MNPFERYIYDTYYGGRNRNRHYIPTLEFPVKVEAGQIITVNGVRYLALAKTKATPIELSHCRSCSLFRKPICELLKCENVRFEKIK